MMRCEAHSARLAQFVKLYSLLYIHWASSIMYSNLSQMFSSD
jgi:hypothetical protein